MKLALAVALSVLVAASPAFAAARSSWWLIGAAGKAPSRIALYGNGMSIKKFRNPDAGGDRDLHSVETAEVMEAGDGPQVVYYTYQVACASRQMRIMARERRWIWSKAPRPPDITAVDVRRSPWESPPPDNMRARVIDFVCTPNEQREANHMFHVTNDGEPVAKTWNTFWRDSPRFVEMVRLSSDE